MSTRIFVSRIAGLTVLDPLGDRVGLVRDVVVSFTGRNPRAIGLVIEVPGKKRVFLPMTRVTSIDPAALISTGLVNMRRFEQRATETLVLAEMFERRVTVNDPDGSFEAVVEDIAIARNARRDWILTKVFVRQSGQAQSSTSRAVSRLIRRRPGTTSPRSSTTSTPSAGPRSPLRSTTADWPTSLKSCPRRIRSRSSVASNEDGPPTSWRPWNRTTRPTCSPTCRRSRPNTCCS